MNAKNEKAVINDKELEAVTGSVSEEELSGRLNFDPTFKVILPSIIQSAVISIMKWEMIGIQRNNI